jgi:hypothetical protein
MNTTFQFTAISRNSKTGPMATTMTSNNSCPRSCEMWKACYAKSGATNIHWKKINDGAGLSEVEFLKKIKAIPRGYIFRHNVAGDLPGFEVNDEKINSRFLAALTQANKGKRGYTYTHKNPYMPENAAAIKAANDGGFTVNLSADTVAEADAFVKLAIAPVVVVLPLTQTKNFKTPAGNQVIICPATKAGSQMTCLQCGVCANAKRKAIIGFPAHGTQKKAASEVANG